MRSNATVALCGITALVATGIWGLGLSWGQDAASDLGGEAPFAVPAARAEGARPVIEAFPGVPGARGKEKVTAVLKFGHPEGDIREAARELSEAEDDEAKAEAENKLNDLLDGYFEEDMRRREEEIADVEARVKKLRELMERRREKKEDIIELQKEVLVNEAEGLGFFNGGAPGGPMMPVGHPFGYGGPNSYGVRNRTEGGDVLRPAVPPPPGGGAEMGRARVFFKEPRPRAVEPKKKPPEEND